MTKLKPQLKGKQLYPIILDIETTLDHKTVRLIGIKVHSSYFTYGNMSDFQTKLKSIKKACARHDMTPCIYTWNGPRFDIPILRRLGADFSGFCLIDLMQMAQMYDHSFKRKGLDAWADKMGVTRKSHPDIDYDNCDIEELREYLMNDLKVTKELYDALTSNRTGVLNDSCFNALRIEHKVAELCQQQVERGVAFDMPLAVETAEDIAHEMYEIERKLSHELPVLPLPASKLDHPPKVQFKKDGTPSAALERYIGRNRLAMAKEKDGPWYAVDIDGKRYDLPLTEPVITEARLQLSNMAAIKDWLLDQGWKPTEWNMKEGKRTGPRLTLKASHEPCPNLSKIGISWMSDYQTWLTLRHRKNTLHSDKGTGWIPMAALTNPPKLASDADTMGANTGRWTHKIVANVPRPSSLYGEEMRRCFKARDDFQMVGWDASALEARIEGHYCFPYDPDYANELCEGDVHTRNLENMPTLGTRDNAKTFKYAITYGAQPPKLAAQFGWDIETAKRVYDDFWKSNPSLKEVKQRLEAEWEATGKRYILGLDGRPIHTRSKHSLLNALFQSAGAIVMKYAMLLANARISEYADKRCFEAHGLIRYHDEEEWEVEIGYGHEVGKLGVESIRQAGEVLGLYTPLTGEYKVGNNWADVH